MNRKRKGLLCQKEICDLWGVALNTLRKERRRWSLRPVEFDGLMPLFDRKTWSAPTHSANKPGWPRTVRADSSPACYSPSRPLAACHPA